MCELIEGKSCMDGKYFKGEYLNGERIGKGKGKLLFPLKIYQVLIDLRRKKGISSKTYILCYFFFYNQIEKSKPIYKIIR